MDILDRLYSNSSSPKELGNFTSANSQELYDFFISQRFVDLFKSKGRIEKYLSEKKKTYKKIDLSIEENKNFINILLDVAERFSFLFEFEQLYSLIRRNNIEVGHRLKAASCYLIGITEITDYTDKIDAILILLLLANQEEEDSPDHVIATLIQFYNHVVYNFGSHNVAGVLSFREKLLSSLENPSFELLKNELLKKVFRLKINKKTYSKIQYILDEFLARTKEYFPFIEHKFIIETGTPYENLLQTSNFNFDAIRQISVTEYRKVSSDNSIFYSLQRGVKVLTEINQLYAYMHSFGKMHYAKMFSSFDFLPQKSSNDDIDIIDWGCGQGLATMCFLEYLTQDKSNCDIKNITLIEPSVIALKRAALHIKKSEVKSNILTINKDLDSLLINDFPRQYSKTKLHLFSNILDIDSISLGNLVALIKSTFSGINYFVCASPFVTQLKTSRLNSFMNSFAKSNNFELLGSIEERKGQWAGTSWSRVIRVFKVEVD